MKKLQEHIVDKNISYDDADEIIKELTARFDYCDEEELIAKFDYYHMGIHDSDIDYIKSACYDRGVPDFIFNYIDFDEILADKCRHETIICVKETEHGYCHILDFED